MGKIFKHFSIVLSNSQTVYSPGNMVDGTVNLELKEALKMREIRIKFVGACRVRWSEGSSRNRSTYWNRESYFDIKTPLYGKAQTHKCDVVLQPGAYQYPFRFQLPTDCPSSFETRKGHVRYFVKAIIDRSWRYNSCMRVFTVLTALDLNQVSDALNPLHHEATESSGSWCCKAGPVRAVIDIPKKGYVPGESIIVKAEVNNEGSRDIKTVNVELIMKAFCTSRTKVGTDTEVVSILPHGKLKSGQTYYWNNEMLPIPALPASYLTGCSLIDIQYYVRIRASFSSVGADINVPVEIVIGTIPASGGMPEYLPTYALPPPPSYSEYALGQTSVQDLEEQEGEEERDNSTSDTVHVFTPMYTYYNFSQPSAVDN